MPVLVAPMSAMLMAHKEGEPATARAAVKANTSMVSPTPAVAAVHGCLFLLFHVCLCWKADLACMSLRGH